MRDYPQGVRRTGPFDLALVTVAAAVVLVLVLRDPEAGFAEWLFGTVLLVLAGYVVVAAVSSARRAGAARAAAARLAATEPGAVALEAIREERRRLSEEITAALRDQVSAIRAEVERLDREDPRPGLRRVHERTQLATSELRRHLGLLREPEPDPAPASPPPRSTRPPSSDVALAAALAAIAAVEVTAYLLVEGPRDHLPWAVVTSVLAAACVAGRTVAPGIACAACAVVFAVGSALEAPVLGGFWTFGTLGALVWVVAARARVPSLDLAGGALMVATVGWTRSVDDPSNLSVTLLVMAVAAAGGLAVRVAGWHERTSRTRAAAREAELAVATRAAITAERAGFARELHDVTSHAIGLIAMQAAAGQVSWPHDPATVWRAVEVIDATAGSTLAELDRLHPGAGTAARGVGDVPELVERIRATGTRVDLTVLGEPPESLGPVVHRVVQESLTNAVRHAPGAAVRVRIDCHADRVVVTVSDEGHGPVGATARGYGLVGLTERVSLAGGSLRTGSLRPGWGGPCGFVVEAVLPVDRSSVTS